MYQDQTLSYLEIGNIFTFSLYEYFLWLALDPIFQSFLYEWKNVFDVIFRLQEVSGLLEIASPSNWLLWIPEHSMFCVPI